MRAAEASQSMKSTANENLTARIKLLKVVFTGGTYLFGPEIEIPFLIVMISLNICKQWSDSEVTWGQQGKRIFFGFVFFLLT